MPRSHTILQAEVPYSISARCINRDWFGMSLPSVWEIFGEELFLIHHLYDVRIHSFVLMNNHFHGIVSTPKANLSEAMQRFMRQTSVRITKPAGRINQTYGARHKPCILGSYNYFLNSYKYIYRNPVAAGVCGRVEDYRFSTLRGLLGFERLVIPLEEDTILFSDVEKELVWLNTPPSSENVQAMKIGLRKRRFALPPQPTTLRKHSLEDGRL